MFPLLGYFTLYYHLNTIACKQAHSLTIALFLTHKNIFEYTYELISAIKKQEIRNTLMSLDSFNYWLVTYICSSTPYRHKC